MKTTLSIEESARLIELGVSPDLANDSAFVFDEQGNEIPCVKGYALKPNEYCAEIQFADEDSPSVMAYIFTLQDLLSILPKKIIAKRATYILELGVCTNPDNWYVRYKHERTNSNLYDLWAIRGELIDAIYEILLKIKGKRYKIQEL